MSTISTPWQLSPQDLQRIAAKVLKGQPTQDKPAGKSSDTGHAQDTPDKATTGPDWQLDPALWQEIQRVIPKEVPQGQLPIQVGTIDGGIKVMLVDGDKVMVQHDMDFIAGGNGAEAPEFIPKDEIWIDTNQVPREWPFDCYHEAHERRLMANKGMEYAHAHERANHVEKQLRMQAMNEKAHYNAQNENPAAPNNSSSQNAHYNAQNENQSVEKPAGKGGVQQQPAPEPSANPDDTRNLAENYAQMWNDFVAAGMPPSEHEIAEVDAELEGSEWKLQQGEDGLWTVVPMVEAVAVQQFARHSLVLQFAAMRAPYGTRSNPFHAMDKEGKPKDYLKGQFIPGGAVEKLKEAAGKGDAASQAAVAQLEGAAAGHQATRQKNMQARQQRDLSKLKGRLSTHAQSQPLDAGMEKSAAYSFRALKRYHGDLLLHRLDEISEGIESRLAYLDKKRDKYPLGTPQRSELEEKRKGLVGMMAKFNRVHQLAEAAGQTQQPQPQTQPQESPAPTPTTTQQSQAVAGEKEPADHTETVSGSEKPQDDVAATASGAALAPETEPGTTQATSTTDKGNIAAETPQETQQKPEGEKPVSRPSYEPTEKKPAGESTAEAVSQEETPASKEPEEKPLETMKPGDQAENPILSHFSAKKPRSFKEIAKRAGLDKAQAAQHIKQLLKEGKIQTVSDENGDRYILNSEKSATAAPTKEPPPAKPAAPVTKPMPPSKNPPPPKPAPAQPAPQPRKLSTNPAEIRKEAQDYQMSPERLQDLEAFAKRREKTGDAAGAQMYRQKAQELRNWLVEHNRMPQEEGKEEYNPGVHEREKPSGDEDYSKLADVMTGKKRKPTKDRPIRLQILSPEAQRVVREEQEAESGKKKGRGRPSKKNKILRAAQQVGEMKAELMEKDNPSLDLEPEPGELTLRQRLQELVPQVERAIANRDLAALKELQFRRESLMMVLQFIRTGD